MKSIAVRIALIILFILNVSDRIAAQAQGALTPAGPPGPTMKTLAQIEPRTPISTLPLTINDPGSYYLTANLTGISGTNGITITCGDVTLDLNGFTLYGVAGSLDAINLANGVTNITVRNGSLENWGGYGFDANSAFNPFNVRCDHLNADGNNGGITIEADGIISDCDCRSNATFGVSCEYGQIYNCTARENGNAGISSYSSTVRDCTANFNGSDGFSVGGGIISDCQASGNTGNGIYANSGVIVKNCQVQNNGANGIDVDTAVNDPIPCTVNDCLVLNNTASGIYVADYGCRIASNTLEGNNFNRSSQNAGILLLGDNNLVEDNVVTDTGYAGIRVWYISGGGYVNNVIVKNSVAGNGSFNYMTQTNNDFGPVGTAATATSPWANISH